MTSFDEAITSVLDEGVAEDDLGLCPYNLRRFIGADPHGTCMQIGLCEAAEEPQCQTCAPAEGWASERLLTELLGP